MTASRRLALNGVGCKVDASVAKFVRVSAMQQTLSRADRIVQSAQLSFLAV